MDENYYCSKLTDQVYAFTLSADRSRMLYQTREGDFYLLPDLRGGEPARLLLHLSGCRAYDTAPDLSITYYQESFEGAGPSTPWICRATPPW